MAAVKKPADDLAACLRVVIAALPLLRRHGVTSITIEDVHLTIEPSHEAPKAAPVDEYDPDTLNPSRFARAKGDGDDEGGGE